MKYYKKNGTLFDTRNSNFVSDLVTNCVHQKTTHQLRYKAFGNCLIKNNCKF
jgi:hypothetical protein